MAVETDQQNGNSAIGNENQRRSGGRRRRRPRGRGAAANGAAAEVRAPAPAESSPANGERTGPKRAHRRGRRGRRKSADVARVGGEAAGNGMQAATGGGDPPPGDRRGNGEAGRPPAGAAASDAAGSRRSSRRRRRRGGHGEGAADGRGERSEPALRREAVGLPVVEDLARPPDHSTTPEDDFAAGLDIYGATETAVSGATAEAQAGGGAESSLAEVDPADGSGRLVLKPRPARRGGRNRRRRGADRSGGEERLTGVSEEEGAEALSGGGSLEEPAKPALPSPGGELAGGEERARAAKGRGRRRRGKIVDAEETPMPEASILPLEDDDSGEGMPDIQVFGERDTLPPVADGAREMVINVTPGAECRVAILHKRRLEELAIERQAEQSHVGNIYKGRITNVEPSIQAAFVDFGLNKNGFLHISDVQPRYFGGGFDEREEVGKKVPRRDRPPIQKCFRRGDEVLVQVAKEGVGTKGPTLTTYLSIPGRFIVMMPGMHKLGVSRKIEDDIARRQMKDLLAELHLPDNMGFILRTAGLGRTKRELQHDLNYLLRLWKRVEQRMRTQPAPCELYQESDLVIRMIRDLYTSDFERIVVDDAETALKAREFLRIAMPRSPGAVVQYARHAPLFHHYGIEEEIRKIHSRRVALPSGGSIVVDSTEAMVAIDVNSGKFRELHDPEETAYRINLEAAEEIARQLRLRDLGGLVVCDFIDMRLEKHRREVERALREALKKHKERARTLRMSKFGLIEMTRQRQRPSINQSVFDNCPHCRGSGLIKAPQSMALEVIRILQLLTHRPEVRRIRMRLAPQVASIVLNQHRIILQRLEDSTSKIIAVFPVETFAHDDMEYDCEDDRGMPLQISLA